MQRRKLVIDVKENMCARACEKRKWKRESERRKEFERDRRVCVCVCGFVCACTDERRRGRKKSLTTEDNKLDWKR